MRLARWSLIVVTAGLAPAAVVDAAKPRKPKTVKHVGALGIGPQEPGESWVPDAGLRFTSRFERLKKPKSKMKRVRVVDFDELFIPCSGGPGYSARDVRIGGFKVKKKGQTFRYKSKLDPFAELGASGASNYSFVFSGRLLSKGKRAEGRLRIDFDDASQGKCSTQSMDWRSGT